MPGLAPAEVHNHLARLPGWTYEEAADALVRELSFPDFRAAMAFVVHVALLAERRNHHPDIVLSYTRVRLALRSHDVGGVTERDLHLAEAISAIV